MFSAAVRLARIGACVLVSAAVRLARILDRAGKALAAVRAARLKKAGLLALRTCHGDVS